MPQKGMAIKKMKKRFILSLILLLIILPGCGKTSKPEVTQPIEQESKSSEAGANNSMKPDQYQLAPPEKGDIIAIITTTMGVIKVKFFPKEAPKAVENFTKLSNIRLL